MNIVPFMRVAIESVVFFGMSDNDVVQPDVAVSQLEAIASALQDLEETDRQVFLDYVRSLAESEQSQFGRTKRVEFLLSLGENLGLC